MRYKTGALAEELYKNRLVNEGCCGDIACKEKKVEESSKDDWSGFKVRFNYDGDELSNYESTVIVKAKDEKEAIEKAKKEVPKIDIYRNPGHFKIDGKIESYAEYKKKYKGSNMKVFESTSYDFTKESDRDKACKEYAKCQQNCLSSSAEKRMFDLNIQANDAGLKFIMTNYTQYMQPHALVTPRYELVEI